MMKAMMILATAMTVMALVSVPAVKAQTECVSKLVPCFNFLNTTTKPSKVCCDSIKEAVDKELTCLCTIYSTPGLLAKFHVTTDQAVGLSSRCDVKTDLSACSSSKGAPTPKASLPPPAGNTGKDAGAGNRLAGYEVTTVIVSLISSIFF